MKHKTDLGMATLSPLPFPLKGSRWVGSICIVENGCKVKFQSGYGAGLKNAKDNSQVVNPADRRVSR